MSKFISSSASYSETNLLKTKFLYNILEKYNEYILSNNKLNNTINDTSYFIPNNNDKYYLFIINKKDITNTNNSSKNNFKICYFFSTLNTLSDFYVEIDNNTCFTKNNYLFEGYLYTKGHTKTFLITDVLTIDSEIVTCKYSLRYSIINNIIECSTTSQELQELSNLNGHLNINIHTIFDTPSLLTNSNRITELFNLFKNNFTFKDSINSIEYINEHSLTKTQELKTTLKLLPQLKKILKTKYSDVYDVINIDTNNNEGILYVKTLNDSKTLQHKLAQESFIIMECIFNSTFNKWQINNI